MSANGLIPTQHLASLWQKVVALFSLEELRDLCFVIGVRDDSLPGETIEAKVTALLDHLNRQGRIRELHGHLQSLRPDVNWAIEPFSEPADPPYKGLAYFDEQDSELFFGRERLTAELIGRLHSERFLAIVGASGSGKSSLARAGIIPALKQTMLVDNGSLLPEDSHEWAYLTIKPTERPLEQLALALTSDLLTISETRTISNELESDPASLHLYILKYLQRQNKPHLLLLIDQFEELFTECKDTAERSVFITSLLAAVGCDATGNLDAAREPGMDDPATVVMTMRADFYAHCSAYPGLRSALDNYQKYIGPMSAEELCAAIVKPAARFGYEFDEGLIELMLSAVDGEPGALPLLSHALLETWRRREGWRLTLPGYQEAGAVNGAIAQTADRVYEALSPNQQEVSRKMLLKLTELGQGAPDTRRRVPQRELVADDDEQAAAVLDRLVKARLVTVDSDTVAVTHVEVAHEALIRKWPKLQSWLDRDREGLLLYRRFSKDAQAWEKEQRNPGWLWSGGRLERVRKWAGEHNEQLSKAEYAFLEASQAQEEQKAKEAIEKWQQAVRVEAAQELAEIEARRAREQGAAARQLRWLRNALILAVVVMAAFGFFSYDQGRNLVAAQAEAERRRLMAESNEVLEQSPPLALLLAVTAVRNVEESGVDATFPELHLRDVISQTSGIPLVGHEALVTTVGFSPAGQMLATASGSNENGIVRLWDVNNPGAAPFPLEGHHGRVVALAFSPDSLNGRRLATASQGGTVKLWNLDGNIYDGNIHEAWSEAVEFEERVGVIAFSPNGRWLMAASAGGNVRLWDMGGAGGDLSAEPLLEQNAHEGGVGAVTFSPDNLTMATAGWDKTVKLWALNGDPSEEPPLTLVHQRAVRSVAYSPDGHWLATASDNGILRLWDAHALRQDAAPRYELPHNQLPGRKKQINAVLFSADGRWLATVGEDATARLWDVATGELAAEFAGSNGHSGPIQDAVFVPYADALWLATAGADQTVRLWNVDDLAGRPLVLRAHEKAVGEVILSGDGRWLATAGGDRTAHLWDLSALATFHVDNPGLDELIELACARAGRNFSQEEWQVYFPGQPYRQTCAQWPVQP